MTAVWTFPNGSTENATMEPVDDPEVPEDTYEVTRSFQNQTGVYAFGVRANDTFGHETDPLDNAVEFELTELAKDINVISLTLNGATTFQEDPPTYRGTAASPENWFNVTAEFNNSGYDDPNSTEGKEVYVYDADGNLVHNVTMGHFIVCDINRPVSGEFVRTGSGAECDEDNDPTEDPADHRARFYVDTRDDRWDDVNITWIGDFNISVALTDPFGKTNISHKPVTLADAGAPLVLEDVDLGPLSADPAEVVTASAYAGDGLRVERVYMEIVKPSGAVEELDLALESIAEGDDKAEERRNGTYGATFLTGAEGAFDQAGDYEVTFKAVDFANTTEVVEAPTLTVNDTDDPTIVELYTDPEGPVEIDTNITFEARIEDSTAVAPPTLTLTRPTSGTQTFPLTFHEETGRWYFTLKADPADVGTWSYTLDVADYAGHTASADGQLQVETNVPPKAKNWNPSIQGPSAKLFGPAQPTITVEVVDPGTGVDPSSITMVVAGENVTDQVQRTPLSDGFKLSYTPPAPFQDGETVLVQVTAADNSEPEQLVTDPPLTHQFTVDAQAPTATLDASPSLTKEARQVIGLISDVNVTATDTGSGPGSIDVLVQHLAGTSATAQETLTFKGGKASFRLADLEDAFQGHGTYRITVTPTDAVGNRGQAQPHVVLYDKSPPEVRVFAEPGEPRESVFAEIRDDASVQEAWILYTPEGGETQREEMTLSAGIWNGTIPTFPRNTTISFTVEAKDFFGNVGSSPEDSFRAGDSVPTITITSPAAGDQISGEVDVTWDANDLETESRQLKVSLYYKLAGEDFKAIPDAQDLSNIGRYTLDTTLLPNGQITLQAIVFDNTNFGDSKVDVTVRNLARIFNSPRMEGVDTIDGISQVQPGQEVTFAVNIDGTVQAAWANVTQNGQQVTSIPLEASSGGDWRGTFAAPTTPGTYNVDLAANTADGPVQTTNAHTFEVQSAQDSKSFVSEWTILSILFAGALVVGIIGLARRW